MTLYQTAFAGYILLINGIAYMVMWFDKFQSKKNGRRVSENNLFLLALFLGSAGIYFGMKTPLYHKAAKAKFKIGIPLMVLINTGVIYYVFYHLLLKK